MSQAYRSTLDISFDVRGGLLMRQMHHWAALLLIPLDSITGVRTTTSEGIGGWWGFRTLVVTTADGTEYGFRGKMSNWQSYLTSALALRGRAVRETIGGISVMPGEAG